MLPETSLMFDDQLYSLLQTMASEGMTQASKGFSDMIGTKVSLSQPQVRLVPLGDVPMLLGGPEREAVGIYLRATGQMSGQIMLIFSYPKALELVDLLMGQTAGTTKALGRLERSALAELGNLTTSFFLNAIASSTGISARPSPPAVMVDMIGAILDIVITSYGEVGKYVLMLQVAFLTENREVEADFWVIPDPKTLETLTKNTDPNGN